MVASVICLWGSGILKEETGSKENLRGAERDLRVEWSQVRLLQSYVVCIVSASQELTGF